MHAGQAEGCCGRRLLWVWSGLSLCACRVHHVVFTLAAGGQ